MDQGACHGRIAATPWMPASACAYHSRANAVPQQGYGQGLRAARAPLSASAGFSCAAGQCSRSPMRLASCAEYWGHRVLKPYARSLSASKRASAARRAGAAGRRCVWPAAQKFRV